MTKVSRDRGRCVEKAVRMGVHSFPLRSKRLAAPSVPAVVHGRFCPALTLSVTAEMHVSEGAEPSVGGAECSFRGACVCFGAQMLTDSVWEPAPPSWIPERVLGDLVFLDISDQGLGGWGPTYCAHHTTVGFSAASAPLHAPSLRV